ncbi:MAG: hypothetical protein K0Q49_2426 [Haloplasmataceae bacterium]|jgi:hypothetical protein|nr:hypothetical protein [Haloplasmataceae bacterium]
MSCGKNIEFGSCVCDVLRDIERKQLPIPECQGGCEEYIRELSGINSSQFNKIHLLVGKGFHKIHTLFVVEF